MAKLLDSGKQNILLPDLQPVKGLWARTKGLIGTKAISAEQGLWFDHCNSIHTCFMSFAIDCVFLDSQMRVRAIRQNVQPWRLVLPVWKARSVIEMKSGRAQDLKIQVGDQLYVGH